MNISGSTIDFPFRVDATGGIVTTDDLEHVVGQAIADIVETTRGERVMCPGYGIDDWVFAVTNFSFAVRIAYLLREQIRAYVPLVRGVDVKHSTDNNGLVNLDVSWQRVASINSPGNLVFPIWRYRNA